MHKHNLEYKTLFILVPEEHLTVIVLYVTGATLWGRKKYLYSLIHIKHIKC